MRVSPGLRLYLVTDRRLCPELPAAVRRALATIPPGSAAVQLREKELGGAELFALARALLPLCRARGAPLLINDRLDVALAAGADGVHLAGSSIDVADARALLGPLAILGASCHDAGELARRAGADLATFGPIVPLPGKPPAVGLAGLAAAAGPLPLFALGGVDEALAGEAIAAGARGVAVIRAWLAAEDPGAATARLLAAVERGAG